MALRQGSGEIQKSLKAIEKSREGGGGQNQKATNFFRWKAGEQKVLRFLTDADEIFVTWVHEFVQGFDGKNRTFVCAKEFGRPCELCDSSTKRREIGYGVAVEREELVSKDPSTGKSVIGFTDKLEDSEEDEDGKGHPVPVVGVVSQSLTNFWSQIDFFYEKYGSLKDLDLDVRRDGGGLDTTYKVAPNMPHPIENIDEIYGEFVPDVAGMLERMGSEEYYDLHLHGIKPEGNSSKDDTAVDKDEEEYKALRNRV